MQAVLVLENGEKYYGTSFGAEVDAAGELIFYSAMSGYQEALCDPAHQNKLLVMTYPIIGSYGVNEEDGTKIQASAIIVKEYVDNPSNFRSEDTLAEMLKNQNVIGIYGIDTRAIVKKLRDGQRMRAAIIIGKEVDDYEVDLVMQCTPLDFGVMGVTEMFPKMYKPEGEVKHRIAIIDYGTKKSVIDILLSHGAEVTVFPPKVNAEDIKRLGFDGLIVCGGGGEMPDNLKRFAPCVKDALELGLPTLGIDMGHLVIAHVFGGKIDEMKKSHRSASCTVRDIELARVYPTQQSHVYEVNADKLPEGAVVSFVNQNDGTIEGLKYPEKNISTVQFYPDAYPKAYGTGYIYTEFLDSLKK